MGDFLQKLDEALDRLSVGLAPGADVGPLISVRAAERITKLISDEQQGRRVVRRGAIKGALVEPSIVVATPNDPIMNAEKFAPLFTIATFESSAELEALMNSSDYLFGATLFGRAEIDSIRLRHPHVAINSCLLSVEEEDAHVPFGGRKRSGFVQDNGSFVLDGPILFSVISSTE